MMSGAEPSVRLVRLGDDQVEETAALLGAAFQQDPLFVHVCPDPEHRARWLPWMFLWPIWWGLRRGEVLGTAGRLDGVAIVVPLSTGGEEDAAVSRLARRDRAERERALSAAEIEAWLKYDAALNGATQPAEKALHQVVPGPQLYLAVLGVEPARQGTGIGGSLLRAVNARAEAAHLPSTLITCQPNNLGIYGRHGYEVACDGTTDSGPRWWGMRRDNDGSAPDPVVADER